MSDLEYDELEFVRICGQVAGDISVDEDIARAVYQFLKAWRRKHAPHPSDDILRVYGIVDDDLIDAIDEIAAATTVHLPESGQLGYKRVDTALDLAQLVQFNRSKTTGLS